LQCRIGIVRIEVAMFTSIELSGLLAQA